MEGRQKTFDWFTREIVPLGDMGTRIILVGNLLHEDSLMMRLRKKIEQKEIQGIYRWFPLLDAEEKCLWPGKFDTKEKIENLRNSVANDLAWKQEYLLEIISDSTRVIHPDWIHYYEKWPIPNIGKVSKVIIGVDLAISTKDSADYSAMVMLATYGYGNSKKAYVMAKPFHKRVTYPELIEEVRGVCTEFRKANRGLPLFVVESNGFQEIYIESMSSVGAKVKGVKHMNDKRSRLALTSSLIRTGNIIFPKNDPTTDLLIAELTGFGKENHDDLADAFSTAVLQMIEEMHESRSFEAWMEWVKSNGGSCRI
jgi:predicted phage terminase large subunit-like protein